jgi:hypothetical protein
MEHLEVAAEHRASSVALDELVAGRAYVAQAFAADTKPLAKAAQTLLGSGRKHLEKKQYDEARDDLVRACFLATAAANRGNRNAAPTASNALTELNSLHSSRVSLWKKTTPALAGKLQLVIRDMSLREALDAIAKAAPLQFRLVEGSLEDAREMLAGGDVRVTYLDLRGATVAEALDWLLQPLRLSWSPVSDRGEILVGSDRRLERVSAWVYDVSLVAVPTQEELAGRDDARQLTAKVQEDGERLIEAIRGTLRVSDTEVAWFAPGQLLVTGGPRTHERASGILAELANPKAKPANVPASLHARTSRRATERRAQWEVLAERQRLLTVAGIHDEYGWKLLAAAYDGELDLEALTELQIAWRADATKKLLGGDGRGLALRSAWAVMAASRLLADQRELAATAASIRRQVHTAVDEALSNCRKQSGDVSALLAAVYGAMAMDDATLNAKVLAALPSGTSDNPVLRAISIATRGLLGEPLEHQQVGKLLASDSVAGEDATVLLALACHRAGRETWSTFRVARQDLLGGQPLAGSVVVLVNCLSGSVGG